MVLPLVVRQVGDYPGRDSIQTFQSIPYDIDSAVQLRSVAAACGLSTSYSDSVALELRVVGNKYLREQYIERPIDNTCVSF